MNGETTGDTTARNTFGKPLMDLHTPKTSARNEKFSTLQ